MADNDWDWTPEVELVKGLSPRGGAILEYFIAIKERRRERLGLYVDTAVKGSGLGPDALAEKFAQDDRALSLFESGLDASGRTAHAEKVRLLGRVVGQALSDEAMIDEAELLVATVRELEPIHVRALTVLVDAKRDQPSPTGVAKIIEDTVRYKVPSNPDRRAAVAIVLSRRLGVVDDIADVLAATLERLGLVWSDPPGFSDWDLTAYGERLLAYLSE